MEKINTNYRSTSNNDPSKKKKKIEKNKMMDEDQKVQMQ